MGIAMAIWRRSFMGEPEKREASIVRYSDVARSPADGQRNGAPNASERSTGDIMFRDAAQLKRMARAETSPVNNPDAVVDHQASQLFEHVLKEVNEVFDAVRCEQPFRLDRIFGVAQTIVDYPNPDRLLNQVLEAHQQSHYLSLNAAHCTILAVQVARGMDYQREELVQLTVASLVHDIGMQKVSRALIDKPGKLSSDELAAVQTHPDLGARLLTQNAPQHPWLAKIVRDEHERDNGQGYPQRLRAEEIHDLAKVIGVVDIYEALISPRPYRRIFSPHEAIQELLDCQEHMGYPRPVVRALIQQLSLFPVGCRVRLSSDEIGRVVQGNSRSPLRPVVEVLFDPAGQALELHRVVDLNANPLLYIVASLPLNDHFTGTATMNVRHA
jgi:HD-GYP domain-containing protein (c-di-GMP phosphodiesterase class II)